MKRRKFITALMGLIAGGFALRGVSASSDKKIGRISVKDYPHRCRVWINGREVTSECFEADDIQGYVRLYKRNEQGRFYVQHSAGCPNPNSQNREWVKSSFGEHMEVHRQCVHLAQERLTGNVRIEPDVTPRQYGYSILSKEQYEEVLKHHRARGGFIKPSQWYRTGERSCELIRARHG